MPKYARTLPELREKAVLFWQPEILERSAELSALPLLLQTQDKFISILTLADTEPDAWKIIVKASEQIAGDIKGNLFLKHLMVLSDVAGELLKKLPPLDECFPDKTMKYIWRENEYEYSFKVIGDRTRSGKRTPLDNKALKVDGANLLQGKVLTNKMEDVIMLLLHAASSINDSLPAQIKELCIIGSFIGEQEALSKFVKQNYIRVSKQLGGAASNAQGQIAQNFVIEKLKERLPTWTFTRNGKIPEIGEAEDGSEMTFDVLAISPEVKYFGIEVGFQVTTNSVIERKKGQARNRAETVHEAGHWIAYVIDGDGNINVRTAAVSTICNYSDCTVALSSKEMGVLARFLRETNRKAVNAENNE